MTNIPEVEDFNFLNFTIRPTSDQQIEIDFFVSGNWEFRGQQESFMLSVPRSLLIGNPQFDIIRFGKFESFARATKAFKANDLVGASDWAKSYLKDSDLTSENITAYNDAGFFLEQANRASEAIPVLEKVVAFDANRTPAYLNLADAYQKSGDAAKAKANDQKYVELMEKNGKGTKVPTRIRAYLKS
jgi:tetratricopeptide (TPR) repeat protein